MISILYNQKCAVSAFPVIKIHCFKTIYPAHYCPRRIAKIFSPSAQLNPSGTISTTLRGWS